MSIKNRVHKLNDSIPFAIKHKWCTIKFHRAAQQFAVLSEKCNHAT